MFRLALVVASTAAVVPAASFAADVGLGSTLNPRRSAMVLATETDVAIGSAIQNPGRFSAPSFDIRIDETVIQLHLLETIGAWALPVVDPLYVGINTFVTPWSAELIDEGSLAIFAGFGGSLDVLSAESVTQTRFGVMAPIGVRLGKSHRLAVYTTPGLALNAGNGQDLELKVSEVDVLVSAWF